MRYSLVLFLCKGITLILYSKKNIVDGFIQEFLLLRKLRELHPLSQTKNKIHGVTTHEDPMYPQLPSTFDFSLPPSLRGEAVRSAIRTHTSGICFDFSSWNMPECNVGGVALSGEGTIRFLEGKLTQSFTNVDEIDKQSDPTSLGVYCSDVVVERGSVQEACLLTSKGYIVDMITVALLASKGQSTTHINEALLLTSPSHAGSALFDRLDPYIFPFDGVKLVDLKVLHPMYPTNKDQGKRRRTRVFTVAASTHAVALNTVERLLTPIFIKERIIQTGSKLPLPMEDSNDFIRLSLTRTSKSSSSISDHRELVQVNILPRTFLPPCVCKGFTFAITESNTNNEHSESLADLLWNALTSPLNGDGPILLGPLEWDTLRIESGFPGFATEMTGEWSDTIDPDHAQLDEDSTTENPTSFDNDNSLPSKGHEHKKMPLASSLQTYYSLVSKRALIGLRTSPLELKLDKLIDVNKGCYQGQEQIAATLKNMRGAPRTLYSISFPDDDNFYDEFSSEDGDHLKHDIGSLEIQTKPPKVGDALYVLGSNEKIYVGRITSIAERGGTSRPETVAIALVRRFDSIIRAMKDMDLDMNFDRNLSELENDDIYEMSESDGSGILYPPSLDPLGGLEVCVKGTHTRGLLKTVNWRRLSNWQNLFEKEFSTALIDDSNNYGGSVMGYIPQKIDNDNVDIVISANNYDDDITTDEEINRAIEEADVAAKLAEAAVAEAKRKAERIESLRALAVQQSISKDVENTSTESLRKSEKLDMLKRQAQAALERRRQREDKQ